MSATSGSPVRSLTSPGGWSAALVMVLACGGSGGGRPADGQATSDPSRGPFPRARALTDVTFQATPARLARGRYLAESVTRCIRCHSEPDTTAPGWPPRVGMEGAGRVISYENGDRMVAPNLTPDAETGAGAWPDDALARAIREGVGHDGRALGLPMPWESFRSLSDEDLASIIGYVRSLPPVRNPLPARELSAARLEELAEDPAPLTAPVPERDLSDPLERGKYLVEISDCVGCHTSWYSDRPVGLFGGGNQLGEVLFSTNITPDSSGIGEWGEQGFRQIIHTGKGGTLHRAMPWIVFGRMTDEDLDAIYRALREVPPVRHWINNTVAPTFCEVCGQEHGLGELNERIPFVPADVPADVLAEYAGRYSSDAGEVVEVSVGSSAGGLAFVFDDGWRMEAEPVSEARFRNREPSAEPIEFVRDDGGRVTHFRVRWGIDEEVFRRER